MSASSTSSRVPSPPGSATKASPRSSMIALRSRSPSVTISSETPRSPTPRSSSAFGMTPVTRPPLARTARDSDAHQPDAAASVDEPPLPLGQLLAQLLGRGEELRIDEVARSAEHRDGGDHWPRPSLSSAMAALRRRPLALARESAVPAKRRRKSLVGHLQHGPGAGIALGRKERGMTPTPGPSGSTGTRSGRGRSRTASRRCRREATGRCRRGARWSRTRCTGARRARTAPRTRRSGRRRGRRGSSRSGRPSARRARAPPWSGGRR